jgi:hypothetical protein
MGKIQLKQALERLNEVTEQLRIAQARIEETGKAENASARFCQSQQETTEEEQKRARKKRDGSATVDYDLRITTAKAETLIIFRVY